MSEFTCKYGHIMGSEERRKGQCAECGEPVMYMDGMTARQILQMEERDRMRSESELGEQDGALEGHPW